MRWSRAQNHSDAKTDQLKDVTEPCPHTDQAIPAQMEALQAHAKLLNLRKECRSSSSKLRHT